MHIDVVQSSTGTSLQPSKQIKTGDVVHGKVMASADGKATVKLQDGSSFNATLADGVSLKEGQQVKLVVTGQQDGKMTMQIAPEGEGTARLAESTLAGMSLPTGGKNVELATAFLRQGVSLSPELMQRAADIIAKNPGLDPDTAAFMAANNMDSNLAQAVQDLASKQNGIASQLAALEHILIAAGGEAQPTAIQNDAPAAQPGQAAEAGQADSPVIPTADPSKGTPSEAKSAHLGGTPVAGTASENPSPAAKPIQTGQPAESTATLPGQGESISQAEPQRGESAQPSIQPGEGQAQRSAALTEQTGSTTQATVFENRPGHTGQASQAVLTAQTTQHSGTAQSSGINQPAGSEAQAALADFRPGPETVKALTIFIGRDNPGAVASLQPEGITSAAEAMTQAAALPPEEGEAVLRSFIDQNPQLPQPEGEKLLAQLRNGTQALRESVQPRQEGMGALLGKLGDMFAKLDKNASKAIELKQANRLPEKLEDMQQAIAKAASGPKEAMAATVQRALGQSKAMEQINQFVYTQLPVELNGRKDIAELYVFKRPGKQKRIDAEQVTMVIALDTQNIGHVESLIKVDGKNVFLRFRVDGDGIADALRGGTMEAGEALASVGYNLLELRCELNEEDISILNAATTVQAEFLDVRTLDFFI